MVRPHRIAIGATAESGEARYQFPATIVRSIFVGDILQYDVDVAGQIISVEVATRGGEAVLRAGNRRLDLVAAAGRLRVRGAVMTATRAIRDDGAADERSLPLVVVLLLPIALVNTLGFLVPVLNLAAHVLLRGAGRPARCRRSIPSRPG